VNMTGDNVHNGRHWRLLLPLRRDSNAEKSIAVSRGEMRPTTRHRWGGGEMGDWMSRWRVIIAASG